MYLKQLKQTHTHSNDVVVDDDDIFIWKIFIVKYKIKALALFDDDATRQQPLKMHAD